MAAITVETIEKLNIGSVLAGLKARERAEAAVEAQARALGVTTQQLTREIVRQEQATAREAEQAWLAERAFQAEQAAAGRLQDALAAVSATTAGLTPEQQKLTRLTEQAAKLYQQGTISAEQYAQAVNTVGARQRQLATTASASVSASEAVTTGTRQTAAAMGNLRSQLIDVGVQLQGGQNPLTILSQQGPQIAEALLSAEGAAAAFGGALTTAATAGAALLVPFLTVAGPLWLDYSAAQEQATAAAKSWSEAQDAALPLYDKALKDVQRLTELTQGSLTLDETKAKIAQDYNDQLEASNAPLKDRLALLQDELKTMRVTDARYLDATKEVEGLTAEISKNNRAAAEGAIASATVAEYNFAEAESERILADRKAKATEARKAAKDATKEEAEALKELLFLRGVDEEIAKLGDLFNTEKAALAENAAGYAAYRASLEAAGAAREKAILDDIALAEAQKKADADAEEAFQRRLGNTADLAGATADIVGGLYDYIEAHSDTMSETQKKVALRLFKIQKVLAGSEIAINTVKGVSVALASAPPPANLIPAGIALGQGLAQGAALAATPTPTFDDTPQAVMARSGAPRAQVSLHPDDILIAGKTDASVIGQAMALAMSQAGIGGGGGRRQSLGMDIARNPVNALLTRQLKRATRGKWSTS